MRRHRMRSIRTAVMIFVAFALISTTTLLAAPVDADDNPATDGFTMSCLVTPDLTPDTVTDAGVQGVVSGELMTFTNEVVIDPGTVYQDILARPDGSTYYASYLELVSLPSNLIFDPAGVQFTIDGAAVPVLNQSTPDPTNFVISSTSAGGATTLQLFFPGDEAQMLADQTGTGLPSYTVAGAAETFRLEYRAQAPVGSPPFVVEEGAECFTSLSTGPSNRDTDRPRTAVSIVEPELSVAKTTPADNAYQPGAVVEFDISAAVPVVDTATGSHGVPAAQNVIVVDTVPPGLVPSDAAGNVIANGGTTVGGGVWDDPTDTVTYTIGTILPGTAWLTTEFFLVDPASAPGTSFENTVCGTLTGLTPPVPAEDAGCDTSVVVVASNSPLVGKRAVRISDEADLEQYGIGLPFWYDVTVSLPGNSNYENFTILDNLPDGLIFNGYVSADCAPVGATCPAPVSTLTPTVFPGGSGTAIGWYPDSLPFDVNPRTFTIRYEVELAPTYSNGDALVYFDEFVNDLSINWNTVDRLGDVEPVTAAPPNFDGSEQTDDTVVYDRPLLIIDKFVETSDGVFADENRQSWDYEIGDIATYSLVVTNQGSSDAFDVVVLDAPAGITVDIGSVLVNGVACVGCSLIGSDLQVPLPGPIAPGVANAVTITYEAIPNQNGDLDNVASIPTYEDEFDTPYTENPQDEVGLEIPDPELVLVKSNVAGVTETANTVGTLFPFTFSVTNVSATTAYTPIVTDTPPSGMCNYAGGLDPSAAGIATETAPGVWELDNPLAPGASVTFNAWIEVCGDIDPGSYTNEAELTWTDLNDGVDESGAAYVDESDAPVTLVGPSFVVEKSPAVDAGALTKWSIDLDNDPPDPDGLDFDELNGGAWTIVVTNTGTSTIGGLNVVDPMPDPFEYLPGSATVTWLPSSAADTFTDNSVSVGSGAVWEANGYGNVADFTIGQLAPGAEIRITVPFIHNGEDPSDGQLTRLNTVEVRNDNLTFDPVDHSSQGEYTLIPVEAGPRISKTVSPASNTPGIGIESEPGQPGQQFDFAIEITIPTKATTQTHDIWVLDELPDGMFLVNEPGVGAVPNIPTNGWTVTCTSPDCDTTDGGIYLGSQPGTNGKTELAFWFGDVPVDPNELDRTYVITFRAEIATTFADGTEIIDGFDEPIVNVAMPIFNRDLGLPGGTGPDGTGVPAGVPNPADYERVYPLDPAEVDIQTPRLDVEKTISKILVPGGPKVEVEEVTAGDTFIYTIVATNGGTGDAYDIDINDTLGTPSLWTGENFMQWDLTTLTTSPGGVVCNVYQPSPPDPVENLLCEHPGPIAPGQSITIEYEATTVPNDEFFAQASTSNFDPMIIRNEANAQEYWEAAGQGGNSYSTGNSTTRIFAYTPVPEIDATCVGGADVIPNAPVGTDVQFWAVFGNGDRIDINGNPGGDQTLSPFPVEDLDGDGFPDAGLGFNPEARITLRDTYVFNGVTGTGPGAGDPTYQTYSPFPAPDQILTPGDQGPGTYTLVWNTSLQDIPHSPNHAIEGSYSPHLGGPVPTNGSFLPHYALLIDATKTVAGGATIWYELRLEDAAGNIDRGTSVGEPFTFIEKDRHGCPGGPAPRAWKYPDAEDGVTLAPGATDEFVIYIQQPDETPVPSTFTDILPAGLQYRGDLPIGDPDYAVATMDVIPASWPAGATLEDYFTSSTVDGSGNTTIIWNIPDLDQGLFNDPNNGNADTRWIVRVPVIALGDPLFPNEFVTNRFEWNGGGTIRSDTGAILTESAGNPSIDKRVAESAGLYGETFRYTIDITIPGGYAGSDVVVYDQINRWQNWDANPWNLQDGGNWQDNNFIFPFAATGPWPPAVAGELYYTNHAYTPAEFELLDYVSQTCQSGCGGADLISIVPLPPEPLDTAGTLPIGTGLANPEVRNENGSIGWYLGDIEPAAQDRVLRLVYDVEAPTILEQRQRIVDLSPTNWPLGNTDPAFDDRDSRIFQELSQVRFPNLVQFRQFGGDNAVLGSWEGAGDDDWETGSVAWHDELSSSSVLAEADEVVTVAYPIIDMDKDCGAIGATDDPTVVTNPSVTAPGTPNVECTVTLINRSPVEAFDVNVTDAPLDQCVVAAVVYWGEVTYVGNLASANPWWPGRSAPGTGFQDPADPGVVSYPCDEQSLISIPSTGNVTDTAGEFPLMWDLQMAPNATESVTYQFYVDGWTDQPVHTGLRWNNGSWEAQGQFINKATLGQWTAVPGGDPIGEEVVVQDEVGFDASFINAQKFPYPENRDICNGDASPFVQWNQAPEAASTNLWPWRHHPAGDQYNPASAAHTQGFGDPLNSQYWTEGEDYCADPLQPPDREVTAFSHPHALRQIPLGTHHFSGTNGWSGWGDPWAYAGTPAWGDGWWDRPMSDPSIWSSQYYARPSEAYRWAIDIRVDGLRHISDIDITDTLPVGWDYVPGSATIVDGVWMLGNHIGTNYDTGLGIETGYGEVALPDPALGNNPDGTPACHADNNFHSGGQTMTWNFERDGGGDGSYPWDYLYLDSNDRVSSKALDDVTFPGYDRGSTGWTEKASWVRIHFYATPLVEVFDCDPDPTSSEPFMMENNLDVSAVRDNPIQGQTIEMTDRFDALVPVTNPVNFEKLPDDDFVADETTAYFTVRFENNLSEPIVNLPITDQLQASLPPLPGGGYACGSATATIDGLPITLNETQCVNPLTQATDLTWLIALINPDEVLEITIPIIIPKDETNTLRWDNTASTFVAEFFDTAFEDDGRITVVNPSPAVAPTKTATPNPATVNDVVTYEVSWTADPLKVFMDLAYFDLVPDGLTFESHVGVTCTGGCPNGYTPNDVITVTPQTNADGTTTLMWWFGDMPGSNQPHTWTMTYTVRVDDTYNDGSPVLDEDTITNTVTGYASHENLLDDPVGLLDPSAWVGSEHPPSTPVDAVLDIEEPELTISKSATPLSTPVDGSSTIQYTVAVQNTGGMDAFNVSVTDTPNNALENIVMDPTTFPNSFVTQGWTQLVPEVGWFITELPQGDTAIFTYTAEVVDTFLVDGIWVAENDASIDEFWARPGAEPEPGDRPYTGDSATTATALVAPELSIEKTVAGCSDEFAFVEVGQPVEWCVVVQNVGQALAYNVMVSDELPYLWAYQNGSTSGTGWTPVEPSILSSGGTDQVEWNLGDLAPGDVVEIRFDVVPQSGAPEVVTNWASAEMTDAAGSPLPATITQARDRNPATASLGRYGLEIAKTPDLQQWPYLPAGGAVEWELTISNPATDTTNTTLVVTDFLPAPLTYVASSSADPRVSAAVVGAPGAGPGGTTEIEWTITDLGPLESITIDMDASATGTEVPMQWYVNDVQVTSTEIPDLVANQAKVRFFEPASLGDYTWIDTNADGLQDAGETGINGVIVTLLDANGDPLYRNPTTGMIYTSSQWAALPAADQAAAPIMQVTTSNNPVGGLPGWYEFDELPAGSYQVLFDPAPTGLLPTLDDQGVDDAIDSDANRFTGLSHVVTLAPGEHDPTIDMGLITPEQYDDTLAAIDVEKWTEGVQADTGPGPVLVPGDPVTWTYQVTNTGWTSLADVTVTDSVEGPAICDVDGNGSWDGTNLIPILLPGESRNCYITGTVGVTGTGTGTGIYANTADTTGTPVLPNFDTCDCDPDDPSSWPDDPALNTPAESTDGSPLENVEDEDPSHHYSGSPSIDIEKDTNGDDADSPNGPVIVQGGAVTWTYVVENTGNTALDNVTVSDDQGVAVVCDVNDDTVFNDATGPVIGFMLPGDTVTCQGTGLAGVGPYMNTGLVTGDPVLPDLDSCGCTLDDPSSWPDDEAFYDPAVDPAGDALDAVTDNDPSHHLGANPEIDIEKDTNLVQSDLPPGEPINVGDPITWSYVVENEGTTALLNATVTDSDPSVTVDCDPTSQVSNVIPLLLPGEIVTCEATGFATAGAYANTADVSGTPAFPTSPTYDPADPDSWPTNPVAYSETGTPDVDDTDDSHYFGVEGGLELEKATNTIDADTAPGVPLDVNDPVQWTYEVTNTSTLAMLNVTVTDSDIGAAIDCGGGSNVIPLLAVDAVVTCTSIAPATAVAGQYHNDSDVTGTGAVPSDLDDPGVDINEPSTWPTSADAYDEFVNEPFTDEDPSNYFAFEGGLDLEKLTNDVDSDDAPGEQILEGDPVVWKYVVKNNSNAVMINVFVSDSDPSVTVDCGGGSNQIPVLAIGETAFCFASGTAILGQYMNDSDVIGTPAIEDPENPGGPSDDPGSYVPTGNDPSTDEDPSHYFGADPAIDVEKDTNGDDADTTVGPVLSLGDAVTWTYVVENTGNVPLTNVLVVDSDPFVSVSCPPNGTSAIPLLVVGQSVTCQATSSATLGAYENIADASGRPSELTDPLADPTDPSNYESSGLDEDVFDEDPSHYVAHDGAIMIVKTTNDADANTAPGVFIVEGDPVVWKYSVVNTSQTPLIDLVVNDDQGEAVDCGDGSNSIAVLLPGEVHVCTATGIAGSGQYSNVGDVSGQPAEPDGDGGYTPIPGVDEVVDDDPSNYFGTEPSIEIEKATNTFDADDTVGPILAPGDDVNWTYVVENTGDTALINVTVTDNDPLVTVDCGAGSNVIALMQPDDEVTCTATGSAVLGQYENIADVSGTPAFLEDPAADPTDPDNYAPTGQDDVTDDDPSHYIAHDGAILLEKSTNGVDADVATGPTVDVNSPVTWTYAVTNTSATMLIDVVVTDDQGEAVNCGGGTNVINFLSPGATRTCTATGTAGTGQYENLGSVTGVPAMPDPINGGYTPIPGAEPATDEDPSHYIGADPAIEVEKATNTVDADVATGPILAPADAVNWTYVVENTGGVALTNVIVNDNDPLVTVDCGGGSNVIALLLVGDTHTCTASGSAVLGQYENIADVSGTPAQLGNPASDPANPSSYVPTGQDEAVDDDPSHYLAQDASIAIEKSTNGLDSDEAPGAQILDGDPVGWNYAVTNTSGTMLINLFVGDDQGVTVDCGGGSNMIDQLAPGETFNCTATGFAQEGPYTNIGSVTGTPAVEDPDTGELTPIPGVDDVTADDPSNYFGGDPAITVEKATNGDDADTTVGPVLALGDLVTWTYVVENTGNVALTNVQVNDSDASVSVICPPNGTNEIPLLTVGQSVVCEATGSATLGQYENIADVSGTPAELTDPAGDPSDPDSYQPSGLDDVEADDPSHYVAHDGDVMIVKTTNDADANEMPGVIVNIGDPIAWKYTVVNTSTTPLVDLIVTDDQGEAVDCGGGANSIALLLPSETHVCTATGVAGDGQYSNVGDVTGQPAEPDGDGGYTPIPGVGEVTDDDPSNYFGADAGVDIEKATNTVDADVVTGPILAPGDTVTWTYVVTNTGDVVLIDLTVTDNDPLVSVDCGAGSNTIALLLPSDEVTCTATGTAVLGQYENIADVSGTPAQLDDPAADPSDPDSYVPTGQDGVADDDPSHYVAHDGSVLIVKTTNGDDANTAPGVVLNVGDPVTWTYTVVNTSDTALVDLIVTDDQGEAVDCGAGSNTIALLVAGSTHVCTATGIAGDGQYTNIGSVTGTPGIPDPTNGGYMPVPGAEDVGDDDPSNYLGADPGVEVEKATNSQDADTATGPILSPGDTVTWTYVVTNTGDVALIDLTVTDNDPLVSVDCGAGSNTIALLLPSDEVTCTATGTAVLGQYENIADVSGTPAQLNDPNSDPLDPDSYEPTGQDDVNDDDPSHYVAHDGSVIIEKSTNGVDADATPGPVVDIGDTVTWSYEVTNTSETALINLVVTDNQGEAVDCGDGTNTIPELMTGATHYCTATGIAGDGQYTNIGLVTGTPAIEDPTTGELTPIPGVGEVTDDDPSNYFGADAGVDIEKATNGEDADTPFGPIVAPGDTVTWTFVVANTGNVPLADLVVGDDDPTVTVQCGGGNTIALLVPGQDATCTATGVAGLGSYRNVGDVTGTPVQPTNPTDGCCDPNDPDSWPTDPAAFEPTGQDPVTDEDPSHYVSNDSGIAIEKSTNGQDADQVPGPIVDVGSPVTWTYVVVNTSTTPLMNIIVSDDQGEAVDCGLGGSSIAVLLPGATHVCTAAGIATEGPYVNTGSVTGQPAEADPDNPGTYKPLPGTDPVSDSDPSRYQGGEPAIQLEKATNGVDSDTAPGEPILAGDPVEWTYVVTNTGDLPLVNIEVGDDQNVDVDCGDGTASVALLLLGASVTCTGSGIAGDQDYVNVGSVSAMPAFEDPDAPGTFLVVPGADPVADDDLSHYDGVPLQLDLALRKMLVTSVLTVNPSLHTFSIEVINQGTASAIDIVVTDHLPSEMTLVDEDWVDNLDGTATMEIAGPIGPGESMMVEITASLNTVGTFQNIAGLSAATAIHPDTSQLLGLEDIDSQLGDTTSDPIVDDVLDNSGGDEDDSDVAEVTITASTTTTTTTVQPPTFNGFPNNTGTNTTRDNDAPASTTDRPTGPLAYTGSNSVRLAALGSLLLIVGAGFVLAGRRRRKGDDDVAGYDDARRQAS